MSRVLLKEEKDISEAFQGTEPRRVLNTELSKPSTSQLLNTTQELMPNNQAKLDDLREGRAMNKQFGVPHSGLLWSLPIEVGFGGQFSVQWT